MLNQPVEHGDSKAAAKRILAEMLRDAALKAEVTLPSGERLVFDSKDWFEAVKWLYTHIDGGAKQQVEHSGFIDVRGLSDEELEKIARGEA